MNSAVTVTTSVVSAILVFGLMLFAMNRAHAGDVGAHDFGPKHRGGMMAMMCHPGRMAKMEEGLIVIEDKLELSEQQQPAWQALTDSVDQAQSDMANYCQTLQAEGKPATAPEKLAKMQGMMATVAGLIGQVQPSLEALYTELDDDQKQTLDTIKRHRSPRGMMGFRRNGS